MPYFTYTKTYIAIKSKHGEYYAFLNVFKAYADFTTTVTPLGSDLCPATMNIGQGEAPEKRTAAIAAAM